MYNLNMYTAKETMTVNDTADEPLLAANDVGNAAEHSVNIGEDNGGNAADHIVNVGEDNGGNPADHTVDIGEDNGGNAADHTVNIGEDNGGNAAEHIVNIGEDNGGNPAEHTVNIGEGNGGNAADHIVNIGDGNGGNATDDPVLAANNGDDVGAVLDANRNEDETADPNNGEVDENTKKTNRKRAGKEEGWKRNIKSRKYQTGQVRKYKGEERARSVRGRCKPTCHRNCSQISNEEQQDIHNMFWSIGDATRRHDFLIHHVR